MTWWSRIKDAWDNAPEPPPRLSFRQRLAIEQQKRGLTPSPYKTLSPVETFAQRHQEIMARVHQITYSTPAEGRLAITGIGHAQQELRLLQQEIRAHMHQMRIIGRDKRQRQLLNPLVGLLGGVGIAKSMRARDKEAMLRQERVRLHPFEALLTTIDGSILNLDRCKLDIRRWIESQH